MVGAVGSIFSVSIPSLYLPAAAQGTTNNK